MLLARAVTVAAIGWVSWYSIPGGRFGGEIERAGVPLMSLHKRGGGTSLGRCGGRCGPLGGFILRCCTVT